MNQLYVLPRGGFGNILFNVLIGYSLSKKYNKTLYFIKTYPDGRKCMNTYPFFQKFYFIDAISRTTFIVKENSFHYEPIVLEDNKSYLLKGYFQSYKYSKEYIDEIREILNLKKDVIDATMLHVRRGDYLNLQNIHPVQSEEYYKKALNIIKPEKLYVFSDDIEHVKTWKFLKDYDVEFIDRPVEECFDLMTRCKDFIICNSTLSLSAYLLRANKDAKLCMPAKWFGPEGPHFLIEDLVELTENVHVLNI